MEPMDRHPDLSGQLASYYHNMLSRPTPVNLYRRSSSDDDGRVSKRARASKPKVKSGCITCKASRFLASLKSPADSRSRLVG
jgi:hypothetical protein